MVGSASPRSGDDTPRYWLRTGAGDLPLRDGWVLVGRNPSCDVVLDDGLVSREHVRFSVVEEGVAIEDLSTNGVFIDGERIARRTVLSEGARLVIGRNSLEIVVHTPSSSPAPTLPPPPESVRTTRPPPPKPTDAPARSEQRPRNARAVTGQADAITLLSAAVDRLLSEGRAEAAEGVIASRLQGVLLEARNAGNIKQELAANAAQIAVKLAKGTSKASWVEYAFEICGVNPQPMPLELIEELYVLLRHIPPIRIDALRGYVAALGGATSRLTVTERFALQRLEGLEKLVASF